MKVRIRRGAREIGGTCIELTAGEERLVLDLGTPLTDPEALAGKVELDSERALPDAVRAVGGTLPKVPGLYLWDQENDLVAGVVISHAHQDHYGFVRYVRPGVPVYASEGTRALMEASSLFLPGAGPFPEITALPKWKPVRIGPFTVTGYLVDHSAPDALALLVEAEGHRLFYSGDLRAHGRKGKLFEALLERPPPDIDCLLLEGTMMDRGKQRYPTEAAVEEGLVSILKDDPAPVFVFCSSQNLDRVCSLYRAALRTDRVLVIDLYTAFVLDWLKSLSDRLPQHDTRNVRVKYWRNHADVLAENGHEQFLYDVARSRVEMGDLVGDAGRYVILARANRLFNVVAGRMPDPSAVRLIWSQWSGYLTGDDSVSLFAVNYGIEVAHVHTSGHATVEDLRRLADAVDAKCVVPIHTFFPEGYHDISDRVLVVGDLEKLDLQQVPGAMQPGPLELSPRSPFPTSPLTSKMPDWPAAIREQLRQLGAEALSDREAGQLVDALSAFFTPGRTGGYWRCSHLFDERVKMSLNGGKTLEEGIATYSGPSWMMFFWCLPEGAAGALRGFRLRGHALHDRSIFWPLGLLRPSEPAAHLAADRDVGDLVFRCAHSVSGWANAELPSGLFLVAGDGTKVETWDTAEDTWKGVLRFLQFLCAAHK